MLRLVAVGAAIACCSFQAHAFAPSSSVLPFHALGKAATNSAPTLRAAAQRRSAISLHTMTAINEAETKQDLSPSAKVASPPFQPAEQMSEDCRWILPEDDLKLKDRVDVYVEKGELTEADRFILMNWYDNYKEALSGAEADPSYPYETRFCVDDGFATLVELVRKERNRAHYFNNEKETGVCYEPRNSHADDSRFFDYHQFGVDFTRPMVDFSNSKIVGMENLNKIKDQLAAGDNVVFLSNHQSESDTHCLFTLFEDHLPEPFGQIAKDIVFMAGERVLRDAIVVPFSRGCNLLTVYSKKHIDSEPELKPAKMQHNQRSMKQLGALFAKGGTCMWYAPSGGRDRRDPDTGKVEPAMFDPNAIEMVRLVAEGAGAGAKTHLYPMALATHNIFPPPSTVGGAFGEERRVQYTHLSVAVCDEVKDKPVDKTLTGPEARKASKQVR
mmetsp:Transcript_22170/g.45228  ORF Transcript_22170/g.45228 Transcript_22170/m.45228 type:complete len:443 (-) Transcript_22170:398-1726(-)